MDLTLDAARLSPMLGRNDLYAALLDAMQERRGAHESAGVLKLRLQRALQGRDLTVRVTNPRSRVPAELAFIERTLREVHPAPRMVLDDPPRPQPVAPRQP
jgi:hypothetical protein